MTVSMKKIFLSSVLGTIAVFSVACGSSETANANLDVNTNVAEQQQTEEIPAYTDAATALADGNKFFDENQTEKAIEAYKQATKLNADLAEAHFKLGIAYAVLESEQELIETPVEPVNKEEKPKKETKEKKSNSVLAFENAVTAYKKILKENPKDDVAHFNLGRVYDRLNEDQDARKSLEQAVKLNEENTQYQTELGAVLMKLAQYDEAVRALKKAVEIDEGNAQAIELLEEAEAGKKRVDFGADKLKDTLKGTQEPAKSGKTTKKEDAALEEPADSGKKEPEKKTTPKPAPAQPKKPAPSKSE